MAPRRRPLGHLLVGDETLYSPRVLGKRVAPPHEVQRTAPVAPTVYAVDAEWHRQNTPVVLDGFLYSKYGRPRPLAPHEIERIGAKDGVHVYVARGDTRAPDAFYIPTDASNYQPYAVPKGCCGAFGLRSSIHIVFRWICLDYSGNSRILYTQTHEHDVRFFT